MPNRSPCWEILLSGSRFFDDLGCDDILRGFAMKTQSVFGTVTRGEHRSFVLFETAVESWFRSTSIISS